MRCMINYLSMYSDTSMTNGWNAWKVTAALGGKLSRPDVCVRWNHLNK